jgi:hypothetical protein
MTQDAGLSTVSAAVHRRVSRLEAGYLPRSGGERDSVPSGGVREEML